MGPLSITELDKLLQLMCKMQEAANSEDWQELSRLDSERRTLLNFQQDWKNSKNGDVSSFDSGHQLLSDNSASANKHAALTKEILTLDEAIIAAVQTARQKLLAQNRGLLAQQRAKKLYAQTSSMC